MRRSLHLISLAAAIVGAPLIGAAAADAQTAGYYVAVPAQTPTRASLMTRDTPWMLRGNAYVAARAPERDTVLCEALARSTGALSAFTVQGRAYDADALAKCNAHAKGGATTTAAIATR